MARVGAYLGVVAVMARVWGRFSAGIAHNRPWGGKKPRYRAPSPNYCVWRGELSMQWHTVRAHAVNGAPSTEIDRHLMASQPHFTGVSFAVVIHTRLDFPGRRTFGDLAQPHAHTPWTARQVPGRRALWLASQPNFSSPSFAPVINTRLDLLAGVRPQERGMTAVGAAERVA